MTTYSLHKKHYTIFNAELYTLNTNNKLSVR